MIRIHDANDSHLGSVDQLKFYSAERSYLGKVDEHGLVTTADGRRVARIDDFFDVTNIEGQRLSVMKEDDRIESNTGERLATLRGTWVLNPLGDRLFRIDTRDKRLFRTIALVWFLELLQARS